MHRSLCLGATALAGMLAAAPALPQITSQRIAQGLSSPV